MIPSIFNKSNQLFINSREVAEMAEMIGKKHFHLTRVIAGYNQVLLTNPNFGR